MPHHNQALEAALRDYAQVRARYQADLQAKGIKFAPVGEDDARIAPLRQQLLERGAHFRNAGASIQVGWLSKACEECTGHVGSQTFSTTLKCHRDCYFCFNHNLENYQDFFETGCPWEAEMADAAAAHPNLGAVAVTGGEPLLTLDDSVALLQRAGQLFPGAHTRMYTSGDLLTRESAARLRDVGLTEIRFSVKQDDPEPLQEKVLANMRMAAEFIPDVMVEMPIIPGTEQRMRELFKRFEENGIKGINLLEFCFPFCNWDEFDRRGFVVRNPVFPVMYDYQYSGGLAVSGSEELCLKLMLWAQDTGLTFGMHYCSLENKHRSEMRQRNERGADVHPCITFDDQDFFLKTAKVFGPDREGAHTLLQLAGCTDFMPNEEEQSLAFPLRFAPALATSNLQVMECFLVLESDEEGSYLTDVHLQPYSPR
ncbi:MAG: radical SAM protein [Coriobacteriia bacterium]|nr:radical SAM protein [Coriobacteriia bacterium]